MIGIGNKQAVTGGGMFAALLLTLAATLFPAGQAAAQVPASCPSGLGTADLIQHDFSVSFCELCSIGTVRIVVENPFRQRDDLDFSELVISENLLASGLTYVANSTRFSGSGITPPAPVEPTLGGTGNSILTWTLPPSFQLETAPNQGGPRATLILEFDVRRRGNLGDEGLVRADRNIQAALALTPSCAPGQRYSTSSSLGELPLREPYPSVDLRGRNVDAGQDRTAYSAPVYGHENDDVIWRVEIHNTGTADLQDYIFSNSIVPGNFEINYVCDTDADAALAADGSAPASCVNVGSTTDVIGFSVAQAFGGGANPYIVAQPGQRQYYYLIGKITDSCTNRTSSVYDIEWGCQSQPPPGGISRTSGGVSFSDSALLSTRSEESGLDIDVDLTGTNTAQPMGAKGTVTITIRNNTGGTIKRDAGIRLRDVLPAEYVIDTTFDPEVNMAPAYSNAYPGMIDTLQWTNPEPGTYPLTTSDPARPLANTDLEFLLTSSTVHPDFPDQFNMIRHGDVVTVTFRTVLIDPQYYDLTGDLDVRIEAPDSDPPGTDKTPSFPISNQLEIWYEEFCTTDEHYLTFNETDEARPEDLDFDIVGDELAFILTNTDTLSLTASLRNNGGHEANDYAAFVSFGEAMMVQTAPAGCTATSNPPPLPEWRIPATIPATASVYVCDRGTIGPGSTENLTFEVVKNTAPSFDDDLTFRVDVIGEILLSDGTPLWFPTPQPRADGITDRANNYSLDALRARVVGYNLLKNQLGVCTENNPPPSDPDVEIEIGEECSFHVESGGWFGFRTPGFTYIAVQNVQVVDQLPDGQGYISSTDPLAQSTPAIQGVSLNPPPTQLSDAWFDWTFNTVVPGERITEKDHWFRADVTTRMLNDPQDTSAPPNVHAAQSTNILDSTFDAVFFNPVTNLEELYTLGPSTVGFPPEFRRRVDLTVTEPQLTVTKEVCNETRYGAGPACTNFVDLADDGDAFDTYVYRITVTNEASAGGVARAPAYDVTVTSVTDASDQLYVDPLGTDVLDNDGDTLEDAADTNGEGVITDNVMLNGVPAEVIASYTHSDDLLRIDPGDSVVLYYRVDPDDDVAPLQRLTASVSASYDSLEGDSGNQVGPPGVNGEIGGARQYVSATDDATIQIIPVEVSPKQIIRTSNSPLVAAANPQPLVIGEEVEFQLRTLIPVATLRQFTIRDELPAGLTCSEAPVIDLDAPPYDAAGFQPGGTFTPTCTSDEVVWNFGDQTITASPRTDRRFDFAIQFIARVENADGNREGIIIRNGGAATVTNVSYVDEAGGNVVLEIGEATMVVREPEIELEKSFSVPEVDAGDLPRVTVTATNTGSTTAYNLRVLDDLSAIKLEFAGDIGGANPPAVDLDAFGPNQPLFGWPQGFGIAPGESVSFSFAVAVAGDAEPHEVLPNTVQADWTSLPSRGTALNTGGRIGANGGALGMRNGALPNAGDALNDYETEASADTQVRVPALSKVDLDPSLVPTIGAHRPFRITVGLPEGTSRDLVVTDDLAAGAASYVLARNADYDVEYEFVGITSINGLAPGEDAFTSTPPDGATGTIAWNIGTVVTETEDDLATPAVDPEIRITYRARINNDNATNAGSTLRNEAVATYTNGETGATESLTDAPPAVNAVEPDLTATKALTNVTPGKDPGDAPALNDVLQYVVSIVNGGNSTAWDVNVTDTLPIELALHDGFVPTATIDGAPVAGFAGAPAGAPDGPLVWGTGNGDGSLDLPPGSTLALTYHVILRAVPDNGATVDNLVWVDWTSLDDGSVWERTGAGCPDITAPDDYCFGPAVAVGVPAPTDPPEPLAKDNLQDTAAIGETFGYRVTVPATPYPFPLYDVRIVDDLAASAADLSFVGVTKIEGSGSWTPVNTGSGTSLVIEDGADGIDIPAGEQVVIEIAVRLNDSPTNVSGLEFTNTASYLFNRIDNNDGSQRPGRAGTTEPMTIVGPDELTLEKSGPPQMSIGAPAVFTLDVHNTATGRAWGVVLTDLLPDTDVGGTCEASPSGFTAQVFEADGTTAVSAPLVEGTDFAVSFAPAPACLVTVTTLSAAASIGADERLIVSYQANLDPDSEDGASLTNIAGATEWYSADTSDPAVDGARQYTRTVTDGTTDTLDHEDAHTTIIRLPVLMFEKTVANLTRGDDPATLATPGDRLRYRLRVENLADTPLNDFAIVDELDRLNGAPAFAPGTLELTTVPGGADVSGTSATGGAGGTGLLDVRGLTLAGAGDSVLVEFEVELAPVIANGSVVTNQSELQVGGATLALSDDPNLNGPADPGVAGDEDPTRLTIESAPLFRVEKISTYLDGNPDELLAGERLRYTITVRNVGSDDASDAGILDQVPVNVAYIPGSTTLNGAPVTDGAGGVAPLSLGLALSAPEDPTAGLLRADPDGVRDSVATLTFDVRVDPDAIDGTVISNQAFVSAVAGGVSDQPSDDPRTVLADDPTRDIVGVLPLLFASKDVDLQVDGGTPGIVDPGDVLRYTIAVYNTGGIPATGVLLTDGVPANTSYVADSVTLNGLPAGQPDAGVSPLVAGLALSSSDLTPPLPGVADGTITAGASAVLTFDLRVNDGVPGGTVISNQAVVASNGLPNLLTDGDGNPSTGPEPTIVIVGDGPRLAITKQVAVVGGGAALPGTTLEYAVTVRNVSAVPAPRVVITDDLEAATPGSLTYVDLSASLNGLNEGVSVTGTVITADYSALNGPLQPDESIVLRFRAVIDPDLDIGVPVTNTGVVTWGSPQESASASATVYLGGAPGVGTLNGVAWHDADFDSVTADGQTLADRPDTRFGTLKPGPDERVLAGWSVELYLNDTLLHTAQTDADGVYRISGLEPNSGEGYETGNTYALRFVAPDATAASASLGMASSPFTNGPQSIDYILIEPGSYLQDLNLPITPNGVVYDAVLRAPVPGVTVTLLDARGQVPLPGTCFDDPVQQNQVTRSDGYYKFDLNFSDPACPSGGNYLIEVAAPGDGYVAGYSQIIPPVSDASTPPLSVPRCAGAGADAVPATATYCEAQASEFAPAASVAARSAGTSYYANLVLDSSAAMGSSQIFNNHLAVDPVLDGAVSITKTTPLVNVSRGQLVPYTITVNNEFAADLSDLSIVDRYPPGFRYIEGSATIDGEQVEPEIANGELIWTDLGIGFSGTSTLQMLMAVGAGVGEGEHINRAFVVNGLSGLQLSGEASATVRVVPDPTFDCTDVTGKVFDDANRNGVQDNGEGGLAGIRLVTTNGLSATTDQHGRYHITCAVVPNETRGSNFVLKLDDRTLPSGFRMSTKPVQILRATRGKSLRFNYGASIHRVVGLDMADAVFVPGEVEMRPQWKPRIGLLLSELRKSPATLRLSYVADIEDPELVERRLAAVKKEIAEAWEALNCCYRLTIEPEVFWRTGEPPPRSLVREGAGR